MKHTFLILSLLLITALLSSCGGMLSQEDEYGEKANFDLQTTNVTLDEDGKYTVLIITDVHDGRSKRVSQSYTPYAQFEKWYASNIDTSWSIDLVCNLGDLTDNSTDEQYQAGQNFYAKLKELNAGVGKTIEIKTILGNHDNRNGGRKKFAEIIDQPPYQAFQVGDKDSGAGYVSFYMLDSSPRAFSKPQMAKLEEALKNDTNPKIFMTHYPLSSNDVSYYYLSLTDTEQRETMIKLMLENKVGLYLAGHRHQQMDPVTYSSSCHELTLASMNGLDTQFESPPTWYIMEVDTMYNMAKIYRCQWSDDGSADGKVTVDSAGMYSFAE
mgnify:CR=1 FL=1